MKLKEAARKLGVNENYLRLWARNNGIKKQGKGFDFGDDDIAKFKSKSRKKYLVEDGVKVLDEVEHIAFSVISKVSKMDTQSSQKEAYERICKRLSHKAGIAFCESQSQKEEGDDIKTKESCHEDIVNDILAWVRKAGEYGVIKDGVEVDIRLAIIFYDFYKSLLEAAK